MREWGIQRRCDTSQDKKAALFAVAIANLLVMMALTPFATALPTISNDLGVSTTTAAWAVTSFLLTLVALLLTAGRMGDLLGHQRVFFWGTVIYAIAGSLCGFAQDVFQLILLRAVQGIGAALISGNSLAILANTFAPEERGKAVGVAGMAASLGALIGVLLASVFAQYLSWRWLFFSLIPLGIISIKAAIDLKTSFQPDHRPKIDVAGGTLLGASLIVFTLAFSHIHGGEATFVAGAPYHLIMLAGAAALASLFVLVELRRPNPMMELRHLRQSLFTMSVTSNGIMHMTMLASTFLVPFLVERSLGLTPLHTAGMLIAMNVANLGASPLSGWLYDRTAWRPLPAVGMLLLTGGLVSLGLFAGVLPYWGFVLDSFVLGVGLGFFMTPNNTVIMGSLPPSYRGFAAGMLETSRQMGHTLGVSASSAVLGLVLVTTIPAVGEKAAYLMGFQQATLVAGAISFIGLLLTLVSSRVVPATEEVLVTARA